MADHLTEADGRRLAADMFAEIAEWWNVPLDDSVPDEEISAAMMLRDPDAIRRYLAMVQQSGNAQLERGFLWAISDFIGASLIAGQPNLEYYLDQ